jgi:hypothetical protein
LFFPAFRRITWSTSCKAILKSRGRSFLQPLTMVLVWRSPANGLRYPRFAESIVPPSTVLCHRLPLGQRPGIQPVFWFFLPPILHGVISREDSQVNDLGILFQDDDTITSPRCQADS